MSAATAKYTPGPWFVGAQNDCNFVVDAHPPATARVICKVGPSPHDDANARLIAAAPELLDALCSLGVQGPPGYCFCRSQVQIDAGHTGECREARAAIAKAEGGAS